MATSTKSVFIRDATGLTRQLSAKDVLMYNLLNMGLAWPMLYLFFGASAYPGVNLPVTVLVGFFPILVIALLFYYLTAAFPRTGGDYVWVSRIVHPAIGFMESFGIVVFNLSFIGPVSGWFMTFGFSTMFTDLAIATGNSSYLSLASAAASQSSVLIGSVLVLIAIIMAGAIGLKNTFRYQWATFIIMMVGLAVFLLAFAGSSPAAFQSNFNQLSGANYDSLVGAANNAGIVTGFTLAGTLIGSFYSFLNYIGFQFSSYMGGEVRHSEKSQFIGIVGSTVLFAIIVFLMFEAPYAVMGGPFINGVSQLAVTGNSAYTLSSPPVSSFLVIFANPSPVVAVLVPLAIIALVLGSLETIVLLAVRIIFAWSFDGVTPTKLASISEKTGSPNYALAVVAVIGVVYVVLSNFAANVLTFLAYTTSGIFLSISMVGVAGMLLPYKHKDLFEAAPANVKRKLGGIPIVAILGAITFLTGIFVAVVAASPVFTGAAINPYYIIALASVFVAGLVIYEVSVHYHKSQGLDLSMRFKQIPPE
jgi:amino acid transporter